MDQDSAFMSTLINYFFRELNLKIKTVAPYNHQSLQAEHSIKSLSRILTKYLTGQGQMWQRYLPLATFAHNTFNSPNLANHSPYELVFGRKLKLLLDLEMDPDIKVSGTYCCVIFFPINCYTGTSTTNAIAEVWVIIQTPVGYLIRKYLHFL